MPVEPEFLAAGVDFESPNIARIYDYFLGGAHNFAVDRELADRISVRMPSIRSWARGNRRFLIRLVRFCVESGVRQFLDLGSGIPTAGPVHEIARALVPESRVAYVDFEPVAVAHSQQLLAPVTGVSITRADIRRPGTVLGATSVTDVIDLGEPVAVLAVAVLHTIPDDERPAEIVARYRDALVPGSYLAITHSSTDYDDRELAAEIEGAALLSRESATPAWPRSRADIRALLGDLPLVEPGLVDINRWRADGSDPELGNYAAVAHIP